MGEISAGINFRRRGHFFESFAGLHVRGIRG